MFDAGIVSPYNPLAIFVTHPHGDHATHLPSLLTAIDTEPLVCVPKGTADRFCAYLLAKERMSNDSDDVSELRDQCLGRLRECAPGDQFEFDVKGGNTMTCICFKTRHTVRSVGYALLHRRTRLKAAYARLPGNEIKKLRNDPQIDLTESVLVPAIAYVGDSDDSWLDDPLFERFRFPFIVTECTFIGELEDAQEAEERAERHRHTLWAKLRERINHINGDLKRGEAKTTFILTHWSARYSKEEIQKVFADHSDQIFPWIW